MLPDQIILKPSPSVCLVPRLKAGHLGRRSAEIAFSCVWNDNYFILLRRFSAEMHHICHHSVLSVLLALGF